VFAKAGLLCLSNAEQVIPGAGEHLHGKHTALLKVAIHLYFVPTIPFPATNDNLS